jgi:peptidoglycan-N-acetylglucosamine deacetylase
MLKRAGALVLVVTVIETAAGAQVPCDGRADALGTARVLGIDTTTAPRVGRKSFPETLPLGAKEVVLTFDDGPWAVTTPRILDTLKEGMRARYFLSYRAQRSSAPRACPS